MAPNRDLVVRIDQLEGRLQHGVTAHASLMSAFEKLQINYQNLEAENQVLREQVAQYCADQPRPIAPFTIINEIHYPKPIKQNPYDPLPGTSVPSGQPPGAGVSLIESGIVTFKAPIYRDVCRRWEEGKRCDRSTCKFLHLDQKAIYAGVIRTLPKYASGQKGARERKRSFISQAPWDGGRKRVKEVKVVEEVKEVNKVKGVKRIEAVQGNGDI